MAAHHLNLQPGHPGAALEAACNVWLDELREAGDYGRLLAVRGSVRGALDGLATLCGHVLDDEAIGVDTLQGLLCGWGPLRHYRGSLLFAQDLVRAMDLWVAHEATRDTAPWLKARWEVARESCEADLMRTMEAFEHLAFGWFTGKNPGGPSRAAGWFEVGDGGAPGTTLLPVPGGTSADDVGPQAVALPPAAARRLREGDLLWLDVAITPGTAPLAIGHVICAQGRDTVAAGGWATARVETLPGDVRARLAGSQVDLPTLDGTREQ